MVKVFLLIVRGPLESHVIGFAEALLRQGYSRSSAEQHVCFIAHLDRWMQAEGRCWVGAEGRLLAHEAFAQMASASSVKIASSRRPGSTSSSSS